VRMKIDQKHQNRKRKSKRVTGTSQGYVTGTTVNKGQDHKR
jgi:hypothetical protein